jgi:UDP-glucose:O-linked fucose beta-1,3-glucosyltransferase
MQWGEGQLQEWLAAANEREEDAAVLQKYAAVDEARIKELTLEIEKLTIGVQRDQALLDKEVTETHAHDLGLDKTSIIFQQLHVEKRKLITRWEKTLVTMQTRDEEIQAKAEEFQRCKAEVNEKAKVVTEQEKLLEDEKLANDDERKKIESKERELDTIQQRKNAMDEELQQFTNELDSLRNTLATTESQHRKKKAEVKMLQESAAVWGKRITGVENGIEQATANLGTAQMATLTQEEQTRALEARLEEEQSRIELRHTQLSRAQANAAKQNQRLTDLKLEEQTMHAEIVATRTMVQNMTSKIRVQTKRQLDEETLLYKQDFDIAQLERKLNRLQGKVTNAATKEMEEKIKQLEEVLSGHQASEKLLNTQIQKLDDELRLGRKRSEKETKEFAVLSEKLAELELEIRRSQEDLDKVVAAKQDLMVNENVLKLEIRRKRMQLNYRADDVFSLEQQQLQLKAAMDERMDEILIHKELLRTQMKEAKDQRSTVFKELQERESRIDKLRKRHEIVVFSTAPSEDGEQKSQAFLLVQAAQEREELQSLGDELDMKIRKGEKEIRQLENVLFKMTGKNHKFRQSLRKVGESDQDAMDKERLQAQHRSVMDRFRHKRRERNRLQEEVEQLRESVAQMDGSLDQLRTEVGHTAAVIANLDAELAEQQGKRDRAIKFAKTVVTSHRKESGDAREETAAEMDYRLRDAKTFNVKVLDMIDSVVRQHPEIATEVNMLYNQAGIDAKERDRMASSLSGSSRASSVASSSRSQRNVASRAKRSQAATSNEAAARRAGAVTPKTMQFGV